MLLATVLSFIVAVGVFMGAYTAGNFLVWKYYLDEKRVEERSLDHINDFQEYVRNNNLFTTDVERIDKWTGSKFIELIIYKDDQLIYSPEWFEKETDEATELPTEQGSEINTEQVSELSSEESGDVQAETKKEQYPYGEGRDFRDYLNEDTRKEYENALAEILEGNRELSPVLFKDGTLLVTVVDYSENLMYSGVVVGSAALAFIVLMVAVMLSFSRLTSRITKLASNVRQVESGKLEVPVIASGNDEIARLASDIDEMRTSIISNMSKEQEAWEANTGLITAMSHDIRTPLTILLGYIDLLELQTDDATEKEYISACRENAIRLKKLSDDMFGYFLVFGKREIQLDFSEQSAGDVINHMLDEHIILLRESGYNVEKTSEDIDGNIYVDLLYFGRVIDNVFSNIKKYADKSNPVKIYATQADGNVIVEMSNKISDSNTAESSGIGIKTCTKIMEQMSGAFRVCDNEESFTSIIKLPLK